jgi:putative hydrolase of the HAD superfamily
MLKAVLFDMDDTLLDWSGFDSDWGVIEAAHLTRVIDHLRTTHQFDLELGRFGTTMRERTIAAWTAARQDLRAPNLGTLLVETARELGAPSAIDARTCLEHYGWGVIEGTVIFPDVPPLLDLLKKHGIQVGIVTNAYQPMWLREIELRAHQLLDYFPTCRISAADVGYLKPHPTIFKTALDCVGVQPHEMVFVGDDLHADIGGAQRAGIRAVLRIVERAQRSADDLITPDAALHSFDQLPGILDDWFPGWRS